MTDTVKRKSLRYLLLAVILTVLIAVALPQLKLKPGIPLPGLEGGSGSPADETNPFLAISINTFFLAVLGLALAFALVYGGYKVLIGAPWKEILRAFLYFTGLTLVVLAFILALTKVRITSELPEMELLPEPLRVSGPPLGLMPPFLVWLAWICLAVVVILLGIWLYTWRSRQSRPADQLEWEAEQALQALGRGLDLGNVILRCYRQMSLVLQQEQGLELEETMTAREFERLLEARGIPHTPVHQLTQLFEATRYGHQQPDADDEQKAFDCLSAIVAYCRQKRL
jgi:hypothetical protein